MKTLVIHPNDKTDYLCNIYANIECVVIRDDFENINKALRKFDRIIMLGNGDQDGLLYKDEYIINTKHANILRSKYCVCIWNDANYFVNKCDLHGFYSGKLNEYQCELIFANNYAINNKNILYELQKYKDVEFYQNLEYIEITKLDYFAYGLFMKDLENQIDYGGSIIPTPIDFKLNSIRFGKSTSGFFKDYYKEFYDGAKILLRTDKIKKICNII